MKSKLYLKVYRGLLNNTVFLSNALRDILLLDLKTKEISVSILELKSGFIVYKDDKSTIKFNITGRNNYCCYSRDLVNQLFTNTDTIYFEQVGDKFKSIQ